MAEAAGVGDRDQISADVFSEKHLIARPLLEAMRPQPGGAPVLLIDEIDRADEPFEAFLLEALSDFQVTIPEIGVVKAPEPPIVIVTSNRTREVHDALKRRCLYHWVDYPDFDREMQILRAKAPEASGNPVPRSCRFYSAPARSGSVQKSRRRGNAGLGQGAGCSGCCDAGPADGFPTASARC